MNDRQVHLLQKIKTQMGEQSQRRDYWLPALVALILSVLITVQIVKIKIRNHGGHCVVQQSQLTGMPVQIRYASPEKTR